MIKAFILYFLSIKPTHGYEIQKFIQLNQMDEWTKIQSGSIYYALGKMEKDSLIRIQREEPVNGKVRKVYEITPKGKEALEDLLLNEFDQSIYPIGSDKFVAYPFLEYVDKQRLVKRINNHMKLLEAELIRLQKWQKIKCTEKSLGITRVSFEMMISNLKYQYEWHQALLDELDKCIAESKEVGRLIAQMDFTEMSEMTPLLESESTIDLQSIKSSILEHPEEAELILSELIKKVSK